MKQVKNGGAGNDELRGDSDEGDCENDEGQTVPCLEGDDRIFGNTGDALLNGGPANNFGDGGANFDTCTNVEMPQIVKFERKQNKNHEKVL